MATPEAEECMLVIALSLVAPQLHSFCASCRLHRSGVRSPNTGEPGSVISSAVKALLGLRISDAVWRPHA